MPLLQFDTTVDLDEPDRRAFADRVRTRYSEIMQTGTGHIAIVIRQRRPGELSIGRETDDDRLLFLDADIREGRSFETKREFVLTVMDDAAESFGIPESNMKAVLTEHEGRQMMGYDRVGGDWSPDEG